MAILKHGGGVVLQAFYCHVQLGNQRASNMDALQILELVQEEANDGINVV